MPDSAIYDEKSRGLTTERKRFLNVVLHQDGELYDLLDETSNNVQKVIKDNSPRGEVTRPKTIEGLLPYVLAIFGISFGKMLVKNNIRVTDIVSTTAIATLKERYPDFPRYQKMVETRAEKIVQKYTDSYLERAIFGGDFTVGQRIMTIEEQYKKTVMDIIRVGIQEGASAKQIALNIDNVIMGEQKGSFISPFDWYRKRYGFKQAKDISRLPGSVSYQSYRIARTEINDAYRGATIAIHSKSPWNKGYVWRLSRAHPEPDICDEFNGKVFKSMADIPVTHPNCFCYVEELYDSV